MTEELYVQVINGTAASLPSALPTALEFMGKTILAFNKIDDPSEYGFLPYVPTDPPEWDPDVFRIEHSLLVVGSEAVTDNWTLEPLFESEVAERVVVAREEKVSQIEAEYQRLLSVGFLVDMGDETTPDIQYLQVIRDEDKINWSRVEKNAEKLKAAGMDDVPMIPIRTTANVNFTVTANRALEITSGLENWLTNMMIHRWGLKDSARAPLLTAQQIRQIDAQVGWPTE